MARNKFPLDEIYVVEVENHGNYTFAARDLVQLQEKLNEFPGGRAVVHHWRRNTADWFKRQTFNLESAA